MLNIRGALTAMITPFNAGKLDEARLREQIEYQIAGGIDGLVPVGTTGESPTVDFAEHEKIIRITVETAAKRVPVIAGTGSSGSQVIPTINGIWVSGATTQVAGGATIHADAEQENPSAALRKFAERRFHSKRARFQMVGAQLGGERADGGVSVCCVDAADRLRTVAERLGDRAVVGRRDAHVEDGFRAVVERGHHHRAAGSDEFQQRVHHRVGTALNKTKAAQRAVDLDQIPGTNPQGTQTANNVRARDANPTRATPETLQPFPHHKSKSEIGRSLPLRRALPFLLNRAHGFSFACHRRGLAGGSGFR